MRFWILALSTLVGPRWAETSLPDPAPWVPATANLIVYIDWSALLASPPLRGVESSLIETESWAELEEFRELTGMDPLHDVWAMVYFTTPGQDAGSQWGIACYGAFDPERVIESIEARGRIARRQHRETTLHLVPAFGPRLGKAEGDQVLSFPDGSTALFGSEAQVRAMLDTGFGFAPAASEEGELAGALTALTTAETFWAVGKGGGELPSAVGGEVSGLSKIPALVSFSLSARFGSRVRVRARAETLDAEAATRLAELVRGFVAMAALQAQADESLQTLFETLEVETVDELVEISFEVDGDTVREYLRLKGEGRRRRAREP